MIFINKCIIIRGARQNNLKNVSLNIPRNKFIVVTGISGSGKSSLVFDLIYAEGRKRLLECFSPYERQRIKQVGQVNVDSIENISPVLAIEQSRSFRSQRSTVGTSTKLYDFVRLLYSRASSAVCPSCGDAIEVVKPQMLVNSLFSSEEQADISIYAALCTYEYESFEQTVNNLVKMKVKSVKVDKQIIKVIEIKKEDIEGKQAFILLGQFKVSNKERNNIYSTIIRAAELGEGIVSIDVAGEIKGKINTLGCKNCNVYVTELSSGKFSFNTPFGACPVCTGIGTYSYVDVDLLVPDKSKSLANGAINLQAWKCDEDKFVSNNAILQGIADHYGFSLDTPLKDIPKEAYHTLLYGTKEKILIPSYRIGISGKKKSFEGLVHHVDRVSSLRKASVKNMFQFGDGSCINRIVCPDCGGSRLNRYRKLYRVCDVSIDILCNLSLFELRDTLSKIGEEDSHSEIRLTIAKGILKHLELLIGIGIGYLSLSRTTNTLSGGEMQRIRLSEQLDSGLTEIIYVLDEPSVGLHPRDTERLVQMLKQLRDKENTVIVVEHDEDIIRSADHIIDVGPGAGIYGGNIVASGTLDEIIKSEQSITGKYLDKKYQECLISRQRQFKNWLGIENATANNLQNINVKIPLNTLTSVTGVSGSGKSSLIYNELFMRLKNVVKNKQKADVYGLTGVENIDNVVVIDQSPIGRNIRSIPATYLKIFSYIRKLFANTPEAKQKKLTMTHFSFNETKGRCDTCEGLGVTRTQMHFMPDVEVECEVCQGQRYNNEILSIRYRNKTISDVLKMSVLEAYEHFCGHEHIENILRVVVDLGLGYLKLGQPTTKISGGEAQRIKLSYELTMEKNSSNTVYLMDEPTTGLHLADIECLVDIINRLIDKGNTVIVIEHNLNIVRISDYVIDMGPEAGKWGGKVIATGTPQQIANCTNSHTGRYLRAALNHK